MYEMSEINFQREVLDRLIRIESSLDGYEKVKETTYGNQRDIISVNALIKQHEDRIDTLEERNKWLARSISVAVIGNIMALIFAYLKMGVGL